MEQTYGVWAVRSAASIFGHAESWCKEDGKPLEFDSREAAETYAREMNSRITANVHYYVRNKEPEPGAVKKRAAQPELDARAHAETTPRNEAAEKQNEIPGRQIIAELDPLVEIRSAVHSNYAGMVAMIGADNRVYLGREERCHDQGVPSPYYDNQDGSLCFVCDQPDMYYFLYGEGWAHTQEEMLNRGLTMRQYNLLNDYIRQGYECQESDWQEKLEKQSDSAVEIQSRHTREVDRMVHRLDGRYYYDEMGYLRSTERDVRHLFYQLSEAKEELALVVMGNEKLYGTLLNLF